MQQQRNVGRPAERRKELMLTIEEMKQDIILLFCQNCKQTTKHEPAENKLIPKKVWNWKTKEKPLTFVYRKPEKYECTECNTPTRVRSLANSQAYFYHRKYGEEKQQL